MERKGTNKTKSIIRFENSFSSRSSFLLQKAEGFKRGGFMMKTDTSIYLVSCFPPCPQNVNEDLWKKKE